MSFDIQFHTCNLGNKKKTIRDPFTGGTAEVFVDDGLSADERNAVKKLLAAAKAKGSGDEEPYLVKLHDGGEAEVFFDGLDGSEQCDGGMVTLRGLTPKLSAFLFDLARVGNMVMTPIMAEPVSVVTSSQQLSKVKNRWTDAVVVNSAVELYTLLENGITAWRSFRDRAVDS